MSGRTGQRARFPGTHWRAQSQAASQLPRIGSASAPQTQGKPQGKKPARRGALSSPTQVNPIDMPVETAKRLTKLHDRRHTIVQKQLTLHAQNQNKRLHTPNVSKCAILKDFHMATVLQRDQAQEDRSERRPLEKKLELLGAYLDKAKGAKQPSRPYVQPQPIERRLGPAPHVNGWVRPHDEERARRQSEMNELARLRQSEVTMFQELASRNFFRRSSVAQGSPPQRSSRRRGSVATRRSSCSHK